LKAADGGPSLIRPGDPMKLFVTPTSPYGRIARIVVHEKGLRHSVDIIPAQTRVPASPYYMVLPSGRVPYLERDDGPAPGPGLEDSILICRYLDQLDGQPQLHPPPEAANWDYGRLEAMARSMLDGLAVYVREARRPTNEQSPTIVAHEQERARRMAAQWNGLIAHPLMQGAFNMAQITLFVALDVCHRRNVHDWRPGNPVLLTWYERLSVRPSVVATA
jgi:glutathione S-transferase